MLLSPWVRVMEGDMEHGHLLKKNTISHREALIGREALNRIITVKNNCSSQEKKLKQLYYSPRFACIAFCKHICFPSQPSTPRSEMTSGRRKSSSYGPSGKQRRKKTPPPSAIPIEQRFPKVSNEQLLKQLPRDKDEEKEIARAKKKEGWQTMRGEEGSSDSRYTTTSLGQFVCSLCLRRVTFVILIFQARRIYVLHKLHVSYAARA